MKRIQIILFFISLSCAVNAQQGAIYNLYFHDPYYLNPAAAGSKGISVFNISAKEFWLGFPENTPGSQSLVFHTRLNRMNFNSGKKHYQQKGPGHVGFGAMLYNDLNGPIRKTGLLTSYAYHIRLREANMSFGLSAFSYQVFTDREKLLFKNNSDPYLNAGEYFYTTDANFGFYLNTKDYYLSFAANNLTESKIKIKDNEFINYIDSRQYSFLFGYNFKFNKKLFFEPSVLFLTDEKFKNRMDLNLKWIYNQKLWAGFGTSSHSSLNLFIGLVSEQFDFGYSFQLPGNDIIDYSLGSHEIMFSIKFGYDKFNRYQRYYR